MGLLPYGSVPYKLKIGNSITGGATGEVLYIDSASKIAGDTNLIWDPSNGKLTVGKVIAIGGGAAANNSIIANGAVECYGTLDENNTTLHFAMGIGPSEDSARILFGSNTGVPWEIDNVDGVFRWFIPGSAEMYLQPHAGGNTLDLLTSKTIQGVGNLFYVGSIVQSGTGGNTFTGVTAMNRTVTLGLAGTASAQIDMKGTTSGTVSVKAAAAAGTYNFNLPITSGNSGDVLTSGGGSSTAMTWSQPQKTLFNHFADAGNTTTTETDLYSDTTAASQLANNGEKITFNYGGLFVSSGTATREIKVYFAGSVILDTGTLTISLAAKWSITGYLIRVSSTVVRYCVTLATEGAALAAYTASGELTGLTLSGTNIFKITGQAAGVGAATNDIVAQSGFLNWLPV